MSAPIITRTDLVDVLTRWQSGTLTGREVHDWAESHYHVADHDDWEGEANRDFSLACWVLAELDMLNLNLLTVEDVPHLLTVLATPKGDGAAGWSRWEAEKEKWDMSARWNALRHDPLYISFCGDE